MSWKQAQNSEESNSCRPVTPSSMPSKNCTTEFAMSRDVVEAPVDHQRREEELEQQREPGLFGGGRQPRAQRQAPWLAVPAARVARGDCGLRRRRQAEAQPAQEHERLGVQPGITRVVRNQHHGVQRDQRQQQRVNREDGVDLEHAELPLAVQHVAVKTAQVGNDPVRKAYESERREVVGGEAPVEYRGGHVMVVC